MIVLLTSLAPALLLMHDPVAEADPHTCRCGVVQLADGWCAKCRVGYYVGERIESEALFRVLDPGGHEVHADKTSCSTCRELIRAGGFCEDCNMGFVDGRGFFSRLCYHMARGRVAAPDAEKRPCGTPGQWCSSCGRGRIGNREFVDASMFSDARASYDIFQRALLELKRCEGCAIAIVADSWCQPCRRGFRGGQVIPASNAKVPATQPG